MEWAVELGLAGLSKIGWPGVIIVEGYCPYYPKVTVHAMLRLQSVLC